MATRACLLILSLACGCTSPVTLGQPCIRSGECPAPLVCTAGRCREECVVHRDCPLSSRCVKGSDGLGVCTLPDDRCNATDDPCETGLECRSDGCYDPCMSSGACMAGGECSGGVCVRTDGPDAGTPTEPAHRACGNDGDCAASEACTNLLGGQYACRRRCTSHTDCEPSATSRRCVELTDTNSGPIYVCTAPCDLFAQPNGCLSGEACDALELRSAAGSTVAIDCRPVDAAMGRQGASCAVSESYIATLCAPGFDCDGPSPNFVCQQLCTAGGSFGPACPTATGCAPLGTGGIYFRGATVGSCDP